MRILKFIFTSMIFALAVSGNLNAQQTEQQTKEVPKDLKDRIQLFWTYYQREDWENLFEIKGESIMKKEDYVEMMKREKTNPYRRQNGILEVALENTMRFSDSGKEWKIEGCEKIIARDNKEKWIISNTYAYQNEKKEWLVTGSGSPVQDDGSFFPCDKEISLFPIRIEVSKLK